MKYRELILASQSPRRKELLQDSGLAFTIHSETCEEVFDITLLKENAIEQIALKKAQVVYKKYPNGIVLGADTMVCYKEERLGKPKDREDAQRMLYMLQGNTHEVITGVALLCEDKTVLFHQTTYVSFYALEGEDIQWYLDTMEYVDKAGAYGIQGKGKMLVKEIQGDYFNVVGLPIAKVYREIQKLQKL